MPFDVAFGLGDLDRAAWCIIFSEMEGHKFDWGRMAFVEDKR